MYAGLIDKQPRLAPLDSRPYRGKGRAVPTTTPLGRIIHARGLRVYEVSTLCAQAGYRIAPRTMSQLLAGKAPNNAQRNVLARVLEVPVEAFDP